MDSHSGKATLTFYFVHPFSMGYILKEKNLHLGDQILSFSNLHNLVKIVSVFSSSLVDLFHKTSSKWTKKFVKKRDSETYVLSIIHLLHTKKIPAKINSKDVNLQKELPPRFNP